MNKEYIYINGNAISRDEFGNQRIIEPYINLEEVLIQENIIEKTENKIEYLELMKKKFSKLPKKYFPYAFLTAIIISFLVSLYVVYLINNFSNINLNDQIITIFNLMIKEKDLGLILVNLICIVGGTGISFLEYFEYKQNKKKIKGITTELSYLKKILKKQKEDLKEIKNKNQEIRTDSSFISKKIDDSYDLQELKEWMNFYYSLGYDEKKFLKYIRKGILDEKLEKDYTPGGIAIVKEHFENKKLVKKR